MLWLAILFFSWTAEADTKRLYFIHTNDIHSHDCHSQVGPTVAQKGGIVRIAHYIKRRIGELGALGVHPIVTDGGDNFERGSKIDTEQNGTPTINAIMEIPYTVRWTGDHEIEMDSFSDPNKAFWGNVKKANAIGTAYLATNTLFKNVFGAYVSPSAASFPHKSGKKWIRDIFITDVDGVKVGFFSLVQPDLSQDKIRTASESKSIKLAKKARDKLMDAGVHFIVAGTHLGLPDDGESQFRDPEFLSAVDGIDMVLAGNSHHITAGKAYAGPQEAGDILDDLDKYPWDKVFLFNSKKFNGKKYPESNLGLPVYIQAGKNASRIADFFLDVDTTKTAKERYAAKEKAIVNFEGGIYPLNNEPMDEKVLEILEGCNKPEYDNVYETHR